MKRIISATAMAALAMLALSGCTAGPVPGPAPANSVHSPAPNPAQKASLVAEFEKIDPALGEPGSFEDTTQVCRVLLQDAPEKLQIAKARQILDKTAPSAASNDAAKKVINAIKANGFCVRN